MTLDDDIALKLKKYIQKTGQPAKKAVNELLRAALSFQGIPAETNKKKFTLPVYKGGNGLMPGFSWDLTTAQILDQLDENEGHH